MSRIVLMVLLVAGLLPGPAMSQTDPIIQSKTTMVDPTIPFVPPTFTFPVCPSSSTNPRVCEIPVKVDLVVDPGTGVVSCATSAPGWRHTQKGQRAIQWKLNYVGNKDYKVAFFDQPSVPAVALYNDYAYADWERIDADTFIWRIRRKHGTTGYMIITQYEKVGDPSVKGMCQLKDPIITNDFDD